MNPVAEPHVMTVRGPVAPSEIGPTMTHEHVFWDAARFYDPSELHDPSLGDLPMSAALGGLGRWNSVAGRDNLRQHPAHDWEMIAEELGDYREAGGSCIVEMTIEGITPFPREMRRVSEEVDVHIVQGVGFYVHATHPEWIETATVDELERHLMAEVEEGVQRSGVRPGLIGELGTSATLQSCEERVLRAGARVARRTGLPINIHCEPPALEVVLQILDVLADEGHDLRRTSLSHLDEIADLDYHEPLLKSRSDLEKMTTLSTLIERGYENQLVVSMDMGKKHYLKRFGGMGYDHVLRRIVPRLRQHFAVSDAVIEKLLVTTPRRLLTIDPASLA